MNSPTRLPSLPPSPTEEEDISRAGVFYDPGASTTRASGSKGKQNQRVQDPFEDGADSSSEEAGAEGYPPTKDEEVESRRVAENLKRWEMAERQRRKAARDSSSSVATPSLVGGASRRTSLLWSTRRSKQASQASGTHQVLRDTDDAVPLEDMDDIVTASPTPDPENPFTTPMASTVSLNIPNQSAIMVESSESSTLPVDNSEQQLLAAPPSNRPSSNRKLSQPHNPQPPPEPLDLPEPRTPPPRTFTPHASRPPEPIPPPSVSAQEQEDEHPETRWWTDWLCGCRERGDNQAGRTNPFE